MDLPGDDRFGVVPDLVEAQQTGPEFLITVEHPESLGRGELGQQPGRGRELVGPVAYGLDSLVEAGGHGRSLSVGRTEVGQGGMVSCTVRVYFPKPAVRPLISWRRPTMYTATRGSAESTTAASTAGMFVVYWPW